MDWVRDVSAGDWIRDRLDPVGWTIHHFVPAGMPAYARVFHPVLRERPVGRAWPEADDRRAWERFDADRPEIDAELVTWARSADAFGTTMHPRAQWRALIGAAPDERNPDMPYDADGWRYLGPDTGGIAPDMLEAVAPHLVRHTATPDEGYLAVWEGWGDVVGAKVDAGPDFTPRSQHDAFLQSTLSPGGFAPFRGKRRWLPGILSDEISRGPRLRLPDRDHVLFRTAPRSFTDPGWLAQVPWAQEGQRIYPPSLIWPAGRDWVVAADVDEDTSLVAGPVALIRALVADPAVEAHEIGGGTSVGGPDPINDASA